MKFTNTSVIYQLPYVQKTKFIEQKKKNDFFNYFTFKTGTLIEV